MWTEMFQSMSPSREANLRFLSIPFQEQNLRQSTRWKLSRVTVYFIDGDLDEFFKHKNHLWPPSIKPTWKTLLANLQVTSTGPYEQPTTKSPR